MRRWSLVLSAVLLVAVGACGEPQSVGSEGLTDFEEQQNPQRLGERTPTPKPSGTPGSLTVGDEPTPTPEPTPPPQSQTFEVTLIADSPFYDPGAQLCIPLGHQLIVHNQDMTAERSDGRTFTHRASDPSQRAFDSGLIAPGATWEGPVFDAVGRFDVEDLALNFAQAVIESQPVC